MSEKVKLLAWLDSASVATGYGIVAKNVLSYLHDTGLYSIDQLAINYPARFNTINEIPWTQISTKSLDPEEPYGKTLFLRTIAEGNYDLVWIVNDTYVTFDVVPDLKKILERKRTAGKKIPKIVFYYPVDCHCRKEAGAMIEFADAPVCYNDYGRQETLKEIPDIASRLKQIPHGVNTSVYFPVSREVQQELKYKFLGKHMNKFLFLNVNRNSDRKQLARCIYAFAEFRKQCPDSILLLHTQPIDRNMNRTIDLTVVVRDLGLSLEDDVLFPKHYEPSRAFSEATMNELYNAADCFITTDLGEGWGIGQCESLAAGTPVIAPDNTSRRQIFGQHGERGYLYPMKDFLFIENSGLRPFGYTEDVVFEMIRVFRAGEKQKNQKVFLARKWAEEYDWKNVCPKWHELFQELLNKEDTICIEDIKVERI
jgi:glycosyltransferase involved in cell wall biosynthesis